jgi:hypothetical protein
VVYENALPLAGNDMPGGGVLSEQKVELRSVTRRRQRRFIPPVPLEWFDRACVLPGKALAVGLVLWRLARVRRSNTVRLTQAAVAQHGLSRWEKYAALRALESAGLVAVQQRGRRSPLVTVVEPRPADVN